MAFGLVQVTVGALRCTEQPVSAYVVALDGRVSAGILIFRVLTWLLIIPVGLTTLGIWSVQDRRRQAADAAANPVASS